MCKQRLDSRTVFPSGMEDYLALYGWHFSKKLCEHAVSRMTRKSPTTGSPERLPAWDRAKVEEVLRRYGVDPSKFIAYDHVYVMNMARADYMGSSIPDEQHLAMFVKDYLCDPDGYDGVALTRYFADCNGCGEQPMWDDVI